MVNRIIANAKTIIVNRGQNVFGPIILSCSTAAKLPAVLVNSAPMIEVLKIAHNSLPTLSRDILKSGKLNYVEFKFSFVSVFQMSTSYCVLS